MATKCITITVEAYDRLRSQKQERESFSDVINRITGRKSILDLAGLLSPQEADELEKNIQETRVRMRKEIEKRVAEL